MQTMRRFQTTRGDSLPRCLARNTCSAVGTQTDFYDREPQVGLAVDVAVAHFRHTLGPPTGNASLTDRQAVSDTITGLLDRTTSLAALYSETRSAPAS